MQLKALTSKIKIKSIIRTHNVGRQSGLKAGRPVGGKAGKLGDGKA
jgi:hypothetical protein